MALFYILEHGMQRRIFKTTPHYNILIYRCSTSHSALIRISMRAATRAFVDTTYVCLGSDWLGALAPGGRLLVPLQPEGGLGGMLLVTRPSSCSSSWPARFIMRALFIACQGLQGGESERRLSRSFSDSLGWRAVRSLRFDDMDDGTCWFASDGWWLSMADPAVGCNQH